MIMGAVPYTLALLIPAILLSWWAGNRSAPWPLGASGSTTPSCPSGYILTATPYMWLALVLSFLLSISLPDLPARRAATASTSSRR